MKRFVLPLLAVLMILAPHPARAQGTANPGLPFIKWATLYNRHNNFASTVVRNADWAAAQNTLGFADSLTWSRAGGTTVAGLLSPDTTQAVDTSRFPFPPHDAMGGSPGGTTALTDSSTVPWIIVRVRQDTVSYSFNKGAVLDTVRLGAQVSWDGVTWNTVNGTPTRLFDATNAFFTAGEDGLNGASLIALEPTLAADEAMFTLNAQLWSIDASNILASPIINSQLWIAPYVRFLIALSHTGQFAVDIGYWAINTSPAVYH